MSLTRAQRKAIREAGPFSIIHGYLRRKDGDASTTGIDDATGEASIAALNAIVEEPESVAVARDRVLRLAVIAGKSTVWDDSLINLSEACGAYVLALRAAKKTRKT